MNSLFFQISSLFYIFLISFIYFNKKKFDTLENRIYSFLLIVTIITLIIDMVSVYYALVYGVNLIANLLCKIYLLSILCWLFTFTYYVIIISSKNF